MLFIPCQSEHFWLRYSQFQIWLWRFKVQIMTKVKSDGQIWGLKFNRFLIAFVPFGWDRANSLFDLLIQRHVNNENRSKSNQVIYIWDPFVSQVWKIYEMLFGSYRMQNVSGRRQWCHSNRYKNIKSAPVCRDDLISPYRFALIIHIQHYYGGIGFGKSMEQETANVGYYHLCSHELRKFWITIRLFL